MDLHLFPQVRFNDAVAQSVVAAEMAAEDFRKEAGDLKVEIVSADHQNKVDIGTNIARSWLDRDGVTAIVDLPNSGVALSISGLALPMPWKAGVPSGRMICVRLGWSATSTVSGLSRSVSVTW